MSGGGKGGSTGSLTEIPQWLEDAARKNLAITDEVASIGYNPYLGPTVAGFSPQQMSAFQNVNQAAGAFGMANTPLDPNMTNAQIGQALTGIQPPNASADGFTGYSGAGLYQAALDQMPPAQRALIDSFFINPQTGAAPTNPTLTPPPVEPVSAAPRWWEDPQRAGGRDPNERGPDVSGGGVRDGGGATAGRAGSGREGPVAGR